MAACCSSLSAIFCFSKTFLFDVGMVGMTSLTDFVTITDGVVRFVKSLVAHHSERSEELFDDFNEERQNTIQSCSKIDRVRTSQSSQNKTKKVLLINS